MTTPKYFVRTTKEFDTIIEAEHHQELLEEYTELQIRFNVGYHLPQPKYKSWVPRWMIKLITK